MKNEKIRECIECGRELLSTEFENCDSCGQPMCKDCHTKNDGFCNDCLIDLHK